MATLAPGGPMHLKRMELLSESLHRVESRLRLLESAMYYMADSILVFSWGKGMADLNQSKILYVNPAFTSLWGYSIEEVCDYSPPSILFGKDTDMPSVGRAVSKLSEGLPYFGEGIFYTKLGEPIYTRWSSSPMYSGGEIVGVVCVHRDVRSFNNR